MKYFDPSHNDEASIREQYKAQAKKLHPDMGGNEKDFQDLHFEYTTLKNNGYRYTEKLNGSTNYKQQFRDQWNESQMHGFASLVNIMEGLFGNRRSSGTRNGIQNYIDKHFSKIYKEFTSQFEDASNDPDIWKDCFKELADNLNGDPKHVEKIFKKHMKNFFIEIAK